MSLRRHFNNENKACFQEKQTHTTEPPAQHHKRFDKLHGNHEKYKLTNVIE